MQAHLINYNSYNIYFLNCDNNILHTANFKRNCFYIIYLIKMKSHVWKQMKRILKLDTSKLTTDIGNSKIKYPECIVETSEELRKNNSQQSSIVSSILST